MVDPRSQYGQVTISGYAAHCDDGNPEHGETATALFACPDGPVGMWLPNREGLQPGVKGGRPAVSGESRLEFGGS